VNRLNQALISAPVCNLDDLFSAAQFNLTDRKESKDLIPEPFSWFGADHRRKRQDIEHCTCSTIKTKCHCINNRRDTETKIVLVWTHIQNGD